MKGKKRKKLLFIQYGFAHKGDFKAMGVNVNLWPTKTKYHNTKIKKATREL